jgi:hypothetical protein
MLLAMPKDPIRKFIKGRMCPGTITSCVYEILGLGF